jgi:Rrf2 family protein
MNSRFAVAVHIVGFIAYAREEPVTSERIAHSVNTNAVVVRRILGDLRRAGLVETQPGVGGGATLARRPEKITLLDIYRATMEPELLALHRSPNEGCAIGAGLRAILGEVFCEAQREMERVLARVTVDDIHDRLAARLGGFEAKQ